MSDRRIIWDSGSGHPPPDFRQFVGRRIVEAWIPPEGAGLSLLLDGNKVLLIVATRSAGDFAEIKIGGYDGIDYFVNFREAMERLQQKQELRGLTLKHLDGSLAVFGTDTGAIQTADFSRGKIEWVRSPDAPEVEHGS